MDEEFFQGRVEWLWAESPADPWYLPVDSPVRQVTGFPAVPVPRSSPENHE
ncbi:hypothetical protein SAMN05421630_11912 [Prauserella marina]|uniref:Uncharacterized protein n=1 Tax=Prauserella marina TaxID=530584 RepID=A0A1G6ZLL7_9PSEU|nr:hypothetical protein [Prauserella marina]PWV70509.1 hypothetical protein DES30_11614 [Prauserella marina]SDE03704.1 hypothetical protein SAMN05421630_11912 [Prauserella marina]